MGWACHAFRIRDLFVGIGPVCLRRVCLVRFRTSALFRFGGSGLLFGSVFGAVFSVIFVLGGAVCLVLIQKVGAGLASVLFLEEYEDALVCYEGACVCLCLVVILVGRLSVGR